jgi:hypothetical protein
LEEEWKFKKQNSFATKYFISRILKKNPTTMYFNAQQINFMHIKRSHMQLTKDKN